MLGETADGDLFREDQWFLRYWWFLMFPLALSSVAVIWGFVQQVVLGRPFGTKPAPNAVMWVLLIVVGLGVPLLIASLRLVVRVRPGSLVIRFVPFVHKVLPVDQIAGFEPRSFNALMEYGGWGIKGFSRKNLSYTIHGSQGVQLTLADGRRILVGSNRPADLVHALRLAGARQNLVSETR